MPKPKLTKTPENKDHPSVERMELSILLVGMQNAAASFGSRLASFHRAQKFLTHPKESEG